MTFKDKINLVRKTKSGGRNTEVALWGLKTDNLVKSMCFGLKSRSIPRVLFGL